MDEFDKQAREALFFTQESYLTPAQSAVVNRVASSLRAAVDAERDRCTRDLRQAWSDSKTDAHVGDVRSRLNGIASLWEAGAHLLGDVKPETVSQQPSEDSLHYRLAYVLGMVDHEECGPRFLIASEDELVKKVKELTDDHWSLQGREISGEKRFIVVNERVAREEIGNEAVDAWGDRDDSWLLIDRHRRCVVGADGGEPEDQLLVRDWSWVEEALNAVHAEHKPTDLQKALIHMGGVLEERERIAKALVERAEHFEKPVMSYVSGERRFAARVLRAEASFLTPPEEDSFAEDDGKTDIIDRLVSTAAFHGWDLDNRNLGSLLTRSKKT